MDEAEIVLILKDLPRFDAKDGGFWDASRKLRVFAKSNPSLGEFILARFFEYLIRTNAKVACSASIELRSALEDGVLSIDTVMGILERWEKDPVPSIDPNFGACVYEHLIVDERFAARFHKWKDDQLLRKRYIEVGFALPAEQEIELYEWALGVNESDAISAALQVFGSDRKFKKKTHEKRWTKILDAILFDKKSKC